MKKKSSKSNSSAGFRVIIYGLSLALCSYFLADALLTPQKDLAGKGSLKLARVLQGGASTKRASWALWGPVAFTRAGEQVYTELSAKKLGPRGHIWLSGNVSIIAAEDISDGNGNLYSAGKIRSIFNKVEKRSEAGKKAKIMEVYSLPFEFWDNSSCPAFWINNLWGNTGAGGVVGDYFTTEKKGKHYVALEYYSNRYNFSPSKIKVKMIEGQRRLWLLILGTAVLFLLLIINGSDAKSVPGIIRGFCGRMRKIIGYSFYVLGPLIAVAGMILFIMVGETECTNMFFVPIGFILSMIFFWLSVRVGSAIRGKGAEFTDILQ